MTAGTALGVLMMLVATAAPAATGHCPVARDDVGSMLMTPRPEAVVPSLPVLLRAGAVIGTEVIPVTSQTLRTDADITSEIPLKVFFPAGSQVAVKTFEGASRQCIYREGAFEPPQDDEGRGFPTDCLEDADHDGRFETMRFFAYKAAAGKGIVEARITPVRLIPGPPPAPWFKYRRRLRMVSLTGDEAIFAIDNALTDRPEYRLVDTTMIPKSFIDAAAVPDWQNGPIDPRPRILREGRSVIHGLTVDLVKIGREWSATPSGNFAPWLTNADCDGSQMAFLPPTAND